MTYQDRFDVNRWRVHETWESDSTISRTTNDTDPTATSGGEGRPFNALAKEFIPLDQRFWRIRCAIKVEGCRVFGNPFPHNDATYALFSADARPFDMPCIRLEFDFNQILKPPYDFSGIPLSKAGAFAALSSVCTGPSIECTEFGDPFAPLTLRWYRGNTIDHVCYRRVVGGLGDWLGDEEVIRLCPEGRLMERLIRMTWVSTLPMLWPKLRKVRSKIAFDVEANLCALLGQDQPREISIWFLNPWGLDATNLQELADSYSRRRPI